MKLKAQGQEFAKYVRSLEQFLQKVKGQCNFWQNFFQLGPRGFSIKLEQLELKQKQKFINLK